MSSTELLNHRFQQPTQLGANVFRAVLVFSWHLSLPAPHSLDLFRYTASHALGCSGTMVCLYQPVGNSTASPADNSAPPVSALAPATLVKVETLLKNLPEPPSREFWTEFLKTESSRTQLRKAIQILHQKKQYDQVILALQTALLNGQPEPWMYEVLALTMEIQQYPQDEVERVLLSMMDFSARDIQNLLGSAAYLVRLGAQAQALKLYQQVSRLEPSRPEPYLLGMRLADQQKDVDAMIWAATGVLTYYWFEHYEKQHEQAIKLLRDWQLKLEKAGDAEKAKVVDEALQRALQRDLHLKLVWSGDADLDLIVDEPLGHQCSFSQRYTPGGGALLHDGAGPNQANCYEEYLCAFAASGYYNITVSHSSGKIVGNRARLEVTRYQNTDHEQKETINVLFDAPEKKYRISLHQGRRTEATPVFVPVKQSATERQRQTRQTLAQLRREMGGPPQTLNQLQLNPVAAVGYAPIVSQVSSGVRLAAQANVSADRRYVRIGIQPVFTDVTDVFTFTFAGGGN